MSVQGDTSGCTKPPIDFKTKVPLWPGQNGTFVLKSTGGFVQPDVSPCMIIRELFLPKVSSCRTDRCIARRRWASQEASVRTKRDQLNSSKLVLNLIKSCSKYGNPAYLGQPGGVVVLLHLRQGLRPIPTQSRPEARVVGLAGNYFTLNLVLHGESGGRLPRFSWLWFWLFPCLPLLCLGRWEFRINWLYTVVGQDGETSQV